jgi:type II secretory pathway component PulM
MKNLFRYLMARWQQLQPRERRLALWCGVVVGAAALLTIDDWQRAEHARLQKAIPAAETRLATMQKMADELNASLAAGRNEPKAPASIELVAASLKASGLPLTLVPTGTSQVAIQGNVVFDDWINWLAGVAVQGWRVERAQVQRDAGGAGNVPSGSVRVEATLGAAGD